MKKNNKLFVILCLFFFLLTGTSNAANEYFRSIASGNWNSLLTWEMSTNSGSTWIAATITPDNTSGLITVRSPNTVTVTVNVSADQLTVNDSATLTINNLIVFTLVDGSGTDFTVLGGGTVNGTGTFRTQGATISMNIKNNSFFAVNLKINTGTTTANDLASPFTGRVYGNVTVDAGATLYCGASSSYSLEAYGIVTNNGTISGNGAKFTMRGPSLVNNSSITANTNFDTTSTFSGAGTMSGSVININSSGILTCLNNAVISPATSLNVMTGGILKPNGFVITLTSGTLVVNPGAIVQTPGTIQTQGTVSINLRNGSAFNSALKVNTGTTTANDHSSPYVGRIYGNLTVDNGANLYCGASSSFSLEAYGSVTNNGIISGNGAAFVLRGSSLVNNNSITASKFEMDSTSSISGAGTFINGTVNLNGSANITLLSNVSFNPSGIFTINGGGILNLNSNTFNFISGTFTVMTGGTVQSSGLFKTDGTVSLNLRNGSAFNPPLTVSSGTTTATDLSSPYRGRLYGNVTIDNGATLHSGSSSSFSLEVYGNVINNGTITGFGAAFILRGTSLINNNTITSSFLRINSTATLSGPGTFSSPNIYLDTSSQVTLNSDITVSPSNVFSISSGAVFNPNLNTFTISGGELELVNGATITNSGTVRTLGTVYCDIRNGSAFNATLNVSTGSTTANDQASPYKGRLFGNVVVNIGAELKVGTSSSYSLDLYGNVTNNGSINGTTGTLLTFVSGVHTLQGTGSVTVPVVILNGGTVTMGSGHQMFSVNINAGGLFNISNNHIKFSAAVPIIQNGTINTTNSIVEYNGISLQTISTSNITYGGVIINNPSGTVLLGNSNVNDTLAFWSGDLNLNGYNITFSPNGYLIETPGNLVYGNIGYLTITKNIGTPTSVNVGGFGAVLTSAANLGSTVVVRGHTLQTGLNGGTSIKRYYDITPTNNAGLNATLVYKFDDSELDGTPEPSMKLFKSTNSGSTWTLQGGVVNTSTSQITLSGISSFSRWSADSSGVSASIKLTMEAFYNAGLNRMNYSDTIRGYLRNTVFPYIVVDSAIEIVNFLSMKVAFQFNNAPSGTYYIQLKHRNAVETWSVTGLSYTAGTTLNYDFTTAANTAFGSNQIQVDASPSVRFAFWSGDVNQDGTVDLSDGSLIDNDAANFATGYLPTDVNGDGIVDVDDAVYADNNGYNFVGKITP